MDDFPVNLGTGDYKFDLGLALLLNGMYSLEIVHNLYIEIFTCIR